jgi:hypothetical protein
MTTITDPLVRDPATGARGRWLMLIVLLAVASGIPLARTVAAARRSAAAGGLALSWPTIRRAGG